MNFIKYVISKIEGKVGDIPEETKVAIEKFIVSSIVVKRTTLVETDKKIKDNNDKRLSVELAKHEGQPVPGRRGRPKLSDGVCMYPACGRVFESGRKLKQHLKDIQGMKFTDRFHEEHESYVEMYKLSPESVLENNHKSCPVICCGFVGKNPQDLINHLMSLGITPFWFVGCVLEKQEDKVKEPEKKIEEKKIINPWLNPGICGVCMDAECDTIILPCGHVSVCNLCLKDWMKDSHECPTCRGPIKSTLLLSITHKDKVKVYFTQVE